MEETQVPRLEKLVMDLLHHSTLFDKKDFKTNVIDQVSEKVEKLVKEDIDDFAKTYIEDEYLNKFALNDSFKEDVFEKIFDEWDLDQELWDLYNEYYDEDEGMYNIKGITEDYCDLIKSRLKNLYVGIMTPGNGLDTDEDEEEYEIVFEILHIGKNVHARATYPNKIYRLEYLLFLWQIQETNVKHINVRKRKDQHLELLLSKMS